MHILKKTILSFLKKYHVEGGKIAIAVSGGADSLSLVHALCDLKMFEVHALTVDHGLRPESKDESLLVQKMCLRWGAVHHILPWVGTKPKTRIQEIARQKRYDLLAAYCVSEKIPTLFLGHHGNDQVETFFMRLSKGSGLAGLCGMEEVSALNELMLMRPYLSLSKENILDYCDKHGVRFVHDPSNENHDFERVRMRSFLTHFGPIEGVLSSIVRLQSSHHILQEIIDHAMKDVVCSEGILFEGFKSLSPVLRSEVMRQYIHNLSKSPYPPKFEKVEDLISALLHKKTHTLSGYVWKVKGAFIQHSPEGRS